MWFVTENIAELRTIEGPTIGERFAVESNVGEQISFGGFEKEWVSFGACFEVVIFGMRENIQEAENVVYNFCRQGTHELRRNLSNRLNTGVTSRHARHFSKDFHF